VTGGHLVEQRDSSDSVERPDGPGVAVSRAAGHSTHDTITISDITFIADPAGALYWPEQHLLCVADLHLEKGSSFARRGVLLPPYDTVTTLRSLGTLIARYAPRLVVALGDSFHDGDAAARVSADNREVLTTLQRGRDWLWITGNHDPDPVPVVGGSFVPAIALGGLVFRHVPSGHAGEIAGHLHPCARINWRGHAIVRRCFAADAVRMVMPAFGAYTGGLNIRDRAFANIFATDAFTAHLLGGRRIYTFAARRCVR
jgi:DNA ligase-associated metallophosphoesterase